MDLSGWLAERLPPVETALRDALPAPEVAPERLLAAMGHVLFPGGKRLRPALALAACEAVGAAPERAHPMAAAVELVHSYSLIHDDLPCMDDDDVRRGRPSVHVAFDEAIAVLAGDALLAAAFEVLAGAPAPPEARVAAIRELARAAGAAGLVGGQVDDLAAEGRSALDADAVESVHARKSASLIAASVAGGAGLGGADPETVDALRRFGTHLGVAFQIADDLLDADVEEPCSLVRVLGADAAKERAEALLAEALAALPPLPDRAEPLRELARFAVRRSA